MQLVSKNTRHLNKNMKKTRIKLDHFAIFSDFPKWDEQNEIRGKIVWKMTFE